MAVAARSQRCHEEPRLTLAQTWLDSFDWRLHRRGWTLLHEAAAQAGAGAEPGGTLELRVQPGPAPDRHGHEGEVVAHLDRQGVPHRATDLPAGRMREAVTPALGVRCLVVQAVAATSRRTLRILNADDKTVAWVLVETSSLPGAAGSPLGARAVVVGVRGYVRAAQEALQVLRGDLGLATDDGVMAAALAACGRHAGDYSSKLNVPLRAEGDFDAAIRTLLAHLLATVEANRAGACANLDPEFLHDIRVATRRARSLLGEARPYLGDGADLGRLRVELAWLGEVTGPTRDLDVWLITIDEALAGDTALPDTLHCLRRLIDQRRQAAHLGLVDQLGSERFRELAQTWRSASGPPLLAPAAQGAAGAVAAQLIRRAQRRVLRRGGTIGPDSPDEALHDLRKAAKRLRYLLEAFESLCPAQAIGKVIDELKSLQDNLGEFQDCAVQAAALSVLAHELGGSPRPPPEALVAIGYLVSGLDDRRRKARAAFAASFDSWQRPATRRLVEDLVSALASPSRLRTPAKDRRR